MWDKSDHNTSELKVFLVTSAEQTIEIVNQIKDEAIRDSTKDIILGMDCEGLNIARPISLLQMYFDDTTYIFDLLSHNPFEFGLKEILESKRYVKVFHDFCEDAAAILRQYKVTIAEVFDTQIAHREYTVLENMYSYQDSNISLNCLLQKYLGTENSMKTSISTEMTANNKFWEQRPLTSEMIEYASQDVIYLPSIYSFFQNKMRRSMLSQIFEKSASCHFYSLINKNHPGIHSCIKGQYIAAYIKNYHKFAVFCSLNIGSSGIVIDEMSRKFIEHHFQVGEILNLEVVRANIKKNSIELKVPDYYLEMDTDTIKQYCKLAKVSQEDKHKKAVAAIVESGTKLRKTSMSLTAKEFIPKSMSLQSKIKSSSFDATIKEPLFNLKTESHLISKPSFENGVTTEINVTI